MKFQATLCGLGLTLLLTTSCQTTQFSDQAGFETPQAAVDAVVAALRAEDVARLRVVLGPGSDELIGSGDELEDREGRRQFLELYDERHNLEVDPEGVAVLVIGDLNWPFPIPVVKSGESWFLDTEEGREELLDRRIGRNELNTVNVCLALVDAQLEYVAHDWDGDGLHEYAQKLRSSEGMKDGLYWETAEGEQPSPIGELIAAAAAEDFAGRTGPDSYHGYCFRLLREQGENASGGAYDYMAGDTMLGGFAVVAYPASYDDTGIMSFLVSHDAVLYQKDLGPDGEATAKSMTAFDPDSSWEVVPQE